MTIYFYNLYEKHGYLSNFAAYSFYADGAYWRTSEHYYQMQKFTDPSLIRAICNAPTPLEAAIIAHSNNNKVVEYWMQVRDKAMYAAIELKFSQNPDIRDMLKETGHQLLVENAWDDYYWGCGLQKNGVNRLGKILMYYRDIGMYESRYFTPSRLSEVEGS